MIKTALQYHNHTSYDPKKMSGHGLDWANQPNVYKEYPGIEPIQLSLEDLTTPSPGPLPQGGKGFSERNVLPRKLSLILKSNIASKTVSGHFHIDDLSLLLRLTNTLTAKSSHPGGDFYYRSAASAGALYPTEIYVATHGVKELNDGLYYFAIHRHALFPLRKGDFSDYVMEHVNYMDDKIPVIMIFLTAIFFRSAWKYRDRSYRYHLLDTGHILENLTMAFKALGFSFKLSYDFTDEQINTLLGLDDSKEVTLAVVCISSSDPVYQAVTQKPNHLPKSFQRASITAKTEIDYPSVREIHGTSTTVTPLKKGKTDITMNLGLEIKTWEKIQRSFGWPEIMEYPEAVFKRRSQRHYLGSMHKDHLLALAESLCIKDFDMAYEQSLSIGFIVNKVDGFSPGFNLLNRLNQSIGLLNPNVSTSQMAPICLGQSWLAKAAVHFLFMTDLDLLDRTWGPRGYRYAMMTSGRLGERLYVVSTAMGLGCCGIGAFYDLDAAKTIGLNDASRLLYLVAVGAIK